MKMLSDKKGSLLLEALLSVVILSVSLTVIIQSLTTSLRAVTYSSDYTTALFLIDNKMFDLIRKGFIEKDLNEEGQFPQPFDKFQYTVKAEGGQVHKTMMGKKTKKNVTITTGEIAEGETNIINKVNLTIQWGSDKRKNSISVDTYLLSLADESAQEK